MNNYLFIFRQDTTGALVFESAPIPGGRITPSGVRYYATDHLGSTVAVVGNHSASRILDNASYSVYGEEYYNRGKQRCCISYPYVWEPRGEYDPA